MEGPTSSWGSRNRLTCLTLQEHDDDDDDDVHEVWWAPGGFGEKYLLSYRGPSRSDFYLFLYCSIVGVSPALRVDMIFPCSGRLNQVQVDKYGLCRKAETLLFTGPNHFKFNRKVNHSPWGLRQHVLPKRPNKLMIQHSIVTQTVCGVRWCRSPTSLEIRIWVLGSCDRASWT